MNNKYDTYKNKTFKYSYPFTWAGRNKDYLKLVDSRPILKQYIDPLVFRLRFYDIDLNIISDDFYVLNKNQIKFPAYEEIPQKEFKGWEFYYEGEIEYITFDNYSKLNEAILNGYDDIKLKASYIDINI